MKPCITETWVTVASHSLRMRYSPLRVCVAPLLHYRPCDQATYFYRGRGWRTRVAFGPPGGAPCARASGLVLNLGEVRGKACYLYGQPRTAQCEARVLPRPRIFGIDPGFDRTGVISFTFAGVVHSSFVAPADTVADVTKRLRDSIEAKRLQSETIESRFRAQRAVNAWRKTPTGRTYSKAPAVANVDWAAREKAREAYKVPSAMECAEAQAKAIRFRAAHDRINRRMREEAATRGVYSPQPMWVDHKTRSYELPDHGPANPFQVYLGGKPVTMVDIPPIRPILPSGKYDVVARKTQLDKKTGTLHIDATVKLQDSLDQVTVCISDKVDDRIEVKVEVL